MTDSGTFWSKVAERRVSRRRAIAGGGTAVAAAAAFAVVGCARKGGTPTQGPKAGGTLRFGTALPVSYGLDPHVERGTGLAIFPRVYGYLHHVDGQNGDALLLDHASGIEQPDGTTLLFHLRDGVRFQDAAPAHGRAVAAQDVAASILRYRDHPLAVNKVWHTRILDHIETPDAATLRVITRRPYVYSLQALGDISAGAILPQEAIDANSDLRTAGAGSGPFAIARADPQARTWRIERNPGYYGSPPHLDAMEWQVFDDDAAKFAAFIRHERDQVDDRDKAESQAAQAAHQDIVVDTRPSLAWLSLGLRTDAPPLVDPRVREAIDLAIDRDALIRGIAPGGGAVLGPVNQHLAGGFWSLPEAEVRAASTGGQPADQRIARATALLVASGTSGAALSLQTANTARMIDLATAVRDQLLAIGLDVRIDELEPLTWFVNLREGAFQTTLISHEPYETPDVPTRLFHSAGIDPNGNMFGLHDPAIDALVERSWGETQRETRQATLLDAQRQMLASRAMLQLFTSAGYDAAWSNVRNRGPELIGSLAQYHYEQWLDV